MKYLKTIPTLLVELAALLMLAPAANADPYTATDTLFLAALNHGGLCCAQQADTPIWYETPIKAINTGHQMAESMARTPTYQQFSLQKSFLYEQSHSNSPFWTRPMNRYDVGEFIVVAVHYYASPAVECALMKQMGGAIGAAPYWYGTVTYSGGLTVQPDCISFSR
jgi:hypothetical protein